MIVTIAYFIAMLSEASAGNAISSAALITATTVSIQVPAPALAHGYTTLAFYDNFATNTVDINNTGAKGYNWYIQSGWPRCYQTAWQSFTSGVSGHLTVANNALTIASGQMGSSSQPAGAQLASAIPAANAQNYNGTIFNGAMYIEIRSQFSPGASPGSPNSWPIFFAIPYEFLVVGSVTVFEELDFWEAFPQGVGAINFQAQTHEWTFSSPTAGTANSTAVGNWTYPATQPTAGLYFTMGFLLQPSTANSGTGVIRKFFNGVEVLDQLYFTASGGSPGATPTNASGIFSLADTENFILMLGAGPSWPNVISSVSVWCASSACKTVN
jgi:hypothetical protein